MILYLLRHGLAGHGGDPEYPDDSRRPLTQDGRERLERAMKGASLLGVHPDLAVTSPYLRALQTAEIARDTLVVKRLVNSDVLLPFAAPSRLRDFLKSKNEEADVVLAVGHEPHLSRTISFLLTGDEEVNVRLKKGALCRLDSTGPNPSFPFELRWLITSGQLAKIGGKSQS